jgi:hypothetical protein
MSVLNSTRFVILFYSNTCVFALAAFDKIPEVAWGPVFLFLTALNGTIGASKIAEKARHD